jgi:D-hydroxyproline dehydrogenase subunit gamma
MTGEAGASLAATLLNNGVTNFRSSVGGAARAPLCGMGICFECRVRVGKEDYVRACLTTIEAGMEISTIG